MRRLGGVEDEEKWLAEGIAGIQHNAFFMHRALDANNLREVLKYSALMLSELRTSKLSPQRYYDLYMRAFDQLRQLEVFFKDESRHGLPVVDLYELVQHAGNILPRMYLLCTVGSVYIKSKQAPSKDVLKDLVEMCRGVQHPIRGLFLRSYLAQVSRDKLPEIGSDYEGDANTVMDAVEFVLQNFTEMNKLWVRIQHQGPGTVQERQEKERNELRDLVGKNLHVLGQIEGVELEMYKETVLPRILEQVVNGKDELAQYYLMECIIQVFPDEYHLQTLETLLAACTQLMPTVDTKIVLTQLMDRLSNYAASSPDVLHEFLQVEAFAKLNNAIGKVIDTQLEMPIVGAMTLFVSLLTFALRVHPDRLDYVDQVLGACVVKLSSVPKLEDARAMKQVVALLSAPLEKYNDIVTALTLSNYPRVMDHLDDGTNKVMAMLIIQSIMKNNSCISTADKVEVLFELIKGLIKDLDGNATEELDEEDFQEEQNSVARLINMLDNEEPEEMLKIIYVVRKHIMTGGTRRLPFTIPPLVFSALRLVRQLESQSGDITGEDVQATPRKIFQILNQTIEVVSSVPRPELALRLYLQCAEAASDCDLEPVAYEFFTQAFILYEEEIADSKAQVTAIHLIVGTLQRINVFGVENRDTLTHKATGYSARLLKKPDQCRAVYACSHLFWVDDDDLDGIKDGERALLCLRRALRIANAAQQMANATRGGTRRLPFTIPPLVFSALRLVRQLESQSGDITGEDVQATPRKIFQILNQTIEVVSSVPRPELALRLYLQCAEAASDCDLEPVAYEFFTQAFILYEEEIADSKAQVTAIHLIVGTLQRINVFGVENRDTLTHKATGYSARLLKKPDQCRAVYACSHLFWVDDDDLDGIKDGERALLCLRRALRIANAAQQMANATRGSSGPVTLFVEILNKYIYFYEKGNPHITPSDIQSLIELINTEMQSDNGNTTRRTNSDPFFTSTLRYIRFQKQKGGLIGDKYDLIKF